MGVEEIVLEGSRGCVVGDAMRRVFSLGTVILLGRVVSFDPADKCLMLSLL